MLNFVSIKYNKLFLNMNTTDPPSQKKKVKENVLIKRGLIGFCIHFIHYIYDILKDCVAFCLVLSLFNPKCKSVIRHVKQSVSKKKFLFKIFQNQDTVFSAFIFSCSRASYAIYIFLAFPLKGAMCIMK